MRRTIHIFLAIIALLTLFGFGATLMSRNRDSANHAGCRNNLRTLALLSTPFEMLNGVAVVPKDTAHADSVWPGTVFNDKLPPDQRLSWVALALPSFDESLARRIDRAAAWNASINAETQLTVVRTLICPGHVPPRVPGEAAVTMYVGIAGLGADAAALPLTVPMSPRAGAFRYDAPTPFEIIRKHDGISQTLLFGQTVMDLGPWIRGGSATIRGMLDDPPSLARTGGQFGGAFHDGAYFAFVDGSVRFFTYSTDPRILASLATIAGGPVDWD